MISFFIRKALSGWCFHTHKLPSPWTWVNTAQISDSLTDRIRGAAWQLLFISLGVLDWSCSGFGHILHFRNCQQLLSFLPFFLPIPALTLLAFVISFASFSGCLDTLVPFYSPQGFVSPLSSRIKKLNTDLAWLQWPASLCAKIIHTFYLFFHLVLPHSTISIHSPFRLILVFLLQISIHSGWQITVGDLEGLLQFSGDLFVLWFF